MKRKLDSGFKGKFSRRKICRPLMGASLFQGLNEFLLGLAEMFQAMPRAFKRLLETALALAILIVLIGLYLGSVQRASDSARRQLSELGKDPAARPSANQRPPK
jgi:hypothetical protein